MCGIVGYVGPKPVVSLIIEGLRKLEYRGYDSAGIAVVRNREVQIRRSPGKLVNLVRSLESNPLSGEYGIKDLFVGVPVKLGERGVEDIIQIKLNEGERKALNHSAESVRKLVEDMKRLG